MAKDLRDSFFASKRKIDCVELGGGCGRHSGLAKKSTPTVAVVYTVCLVVLLLNEIKKEH